MIRYALIQKDGSYFSELLLNIIEVCCFAHENAMTWSDKKKAESTAKCINRSKGFEKYSVTEIKIEN